MDERWGQVASNRSPFTIFTLVFALSAPFYLVGAMTTFQIIPGVPLSGFVFVCPAIAAIFLILRENGKAGVIVFLKRSLDWKRIKGKIWFAPMILLAPFAALIQYGIMRWTSVPIPLPQFPNAITLILALAL
jgi:hypothetical protein